MSIESDNSECVLGKKYHRSEENLSEKTKGTEGGGWSEGNFKTKLVRSR